MSAQEIADKLMEHLHQTLPELRKIMTNDQAKTIHTHLSWAAHKAVFYIEREAENNPK